MTVTLKADTIVLSGNCGVEEVETLVDYLESQSDPVVDVGSATAIHTALWQAMMVFRPKMAGSPLWLDDDKMAEGLRAYFAESREHSG